MFDNYVFSEGTCKNYEIDGKVEGFEMKTRITYYRGVPCSMIHCVSVELDGTEIDPKALSFSPNQIDFFPIHELSTLTTYKWEYGEEALVRVKLEGGLQAGEHEVTLTTGIRTAYIPVPLVGSKTRKVTVQS